MNKGLELLATGKKRTKVVATLDDGNALLSKQEVEVVEKELKALEIIKKRKCNVADFILDNPTWGEIQEFDYWFKETPTKEEFDLLKEVLL